MRHHLGCTSSQASRALQKCKGDLHKACSSYKIKNKMQQPRVEGESLSEGEHGLGNVEELMYDWRVIKSYSFQGGFKQRLPLFP